MKNKKILVVDDEAGNLYLFKRMFRNKNVELSCCESGQCALDKLSQDKYDLLFLDVLMPDMNGVETLAKIKESGNKIPVIIMTGYAIDDLIDEALSMGIEKVIYKPFELNIIFNDIEAILGVSISKT